MSDARATALDLPGARVLFSNRRGGVSRGPYGSLNLGILTDDDPALVAENRRRLADVAGLDPTAIAMGWQVHGAELEEWDRGGRGFAVRGATLPRVDGHMTSRPGLGLLVLAADCFPVALAAPGRVAMLHCGWRGLAGGIIEAALERFEERPVAAVGPGIGPCCYEVGGDVLRAFSALGGAVRGRALDLRAVIAHKLAAAGVVVADQVEHCTSCRADLYFSHRRDGGVTGRQAGLVVLTG